MSARPERWDPRPPRRGAGREPARAAAPRRDDRRDAPRRDDRRRRDDRDRRDVRGPRGGGLNDRVNDRLRGGPSSDLAWPLAAGGALLVTALAAAVGLHRTGAIGLVFPLAFVVSCAAAALLVRRTEMLVPAVAPPIVATLAITLVWLVLEGGGGVGAFLLGVIGPLAEMFWWLVVATAATLGITVARSRGILER